ncbi:MAG: phosphate signaling complex protein PhoU [Spirochaetales bacterium]|nr:phosphate signaling complex protein PhoU [Spirochaetales bacterium]
MIEARKTYQGQLEKLDKAILKMGVFVEEALHKAITALIEEDCDMAEAIIFEDEKINTLEIEVEDICIALIATNHPVAGDLRHIITSMKIASQLERMGDHAVHIAKNVIRLKEKYISRLLNSIPREGEIVIRMLHEVISAYVKKDVEKAMEIAKMDKEVDELHYDNSKKIIELMLSEKEYVKPGAGFLFIDRFFERLGDHIVIICEWIVYSVTNEHRELNEKESIWHRERYSS